MKVDYNREKLDGEVYYRILCFLAWESHKTGGIIKNEEQKGRIVIYYIRWKSV